MFLAETQLDLVVFTMNGRYIGRAMTPGKVTCMVASACWRYLVTATEDGVVSFWDSVMLIERLRFETE